MPVTGLCYLYEKTNSPVTRREFVLRMASRSPRELAPGPTRVRASSLVVAAKPWGPRLCENANSRRPEREFAGPTTPRATRTRGGMHTPLGVCFPAQVRGGVVSR